MMGTWWVRYHEGRKALTNDAPGIGAENVIDLCEEEVAQLILFLQGCKESWPLTPRPPDSSPNLAAPSPGP